MSLRSGYWLQRYLLSTTAGKNNYQIPARAIANGLEKLEISTDSGVSYFQAVYLTDVQAGDYSNTADRGQPVRFSLEADSVIVYPIPSAAYVLRMSYYLRPSNLTAAVANGIVSAVTPGSTPTLTITGGLPAGLASPGTLDCIHTTGACELSLVATSFTFSNPTVTLPAGTDVSKIVAGDVIRLPETTDYIPLPVDLHRSLADYVAAAILAAKGDFDKAGVFSQKAERSIGRFIDLGLPRVKGSPPRFLTRNTYLRRRTGTAGWGWR